MKAVIELERQGYAVSLQGDRIQVKKKVGFDPDAGKVRVLLQEIREQKADAMRYLEQRQVSVWCPYRGRSRWVSWDACLWHREMNDPECKGCRPEGRQQRERKA